MRVLLSIILFLFMSSALCAGQWIPYNTQVVPTPPVVEVPTVPAFTYRTVAYPVIQWHWIPCYYNVPVVHIEHRLFCHRRTVTFVPQTQWILQPVYR